MELSHIYQAVPFSLTKMYCKIRRFLNWVRLQRLCCLFVVSHLVAEKNWVPKINEGCVRSSKISQRLITANFKIWSVTNTNASTVDARLFYISKKRDILLLSVLKNMFNTRRFFNAIIFFLSAECINFDRSFNSR